MSLFPRVVLESPNGPIAVKVEVARSDAERIRGLMYRRSLAPDAGMLFIFDEEASHTFWMRNTYIPLDIIFINGNKRVVGIVARAEPMAEAPLGVGAPSRYVLEVNGGMVQRLGIASGGSVTFEQMDDTP